MFTSPVWLFECVFLDSFKRFLDFFQFLFVFFCHFCKGIFHFLFKGLHHPHKVSFKINFFSVSSIKIFTFSCCMTTGFWWYHVSFSLVEIIQVEIFLWNCSWSALYCHCLCLREPLRFSWPALLVWSLGLLYWPALLVCFLCLHSLSTLYSPNCTSECLSCSSLGPPHVFSVSVLEFFWGFQGNRRYWGETGLTALRIKSMWLRFWGNLPVGSLPAGWLEKLRNGEMSCLVGRA